jgi:uncharacterized RDD family membrane protein YckC
MLAKHPAERFKTYDELLGDMVKIQPVNTTAAGIALRAMAFVVDQAILLLMSSPFAMAILYLGSLLQYQWMIPLVAFASLSMPAMYLIAMYRGWPSAGRYLFQLRIVEENGLAPRREQLVPREVLRNAFGLSLPLIFYVWLTYPTVAQVLDAALFAFLAVDSATIVLSSGRKALHDILCHSRVVLALDKSVDPPLT